MSNYSLVNKNKNIQYFINSNKSYLYEYDSKDNSVERYDRDKFETKTFYVLDKETQEKERVDFKSVINDKNNFITTCEVVSSTINPSGYYKETSKNGIESHYFNEFLGSKTFIERLNKNPYKGLNCIELLETKTPTINIVLKNLFHNEEDKIIENFINWLNVVSFKDKNQDIIFSFIRTNELEQGQGRGKGVLVKLFNQLFSGLVRSVSNNTVNNNFNSCLMNKKIVIFEEVEFPKLNYPLLKDITGNSTINIEFKGKDRITTRNVGSWLLFSNEWDLCNKITFEDRRMFIIRPNPKNESLKKIFEEKYGDYYNFEDKLFSELEEFIYIISSVQGKVYSPIQLRTNRHKNYFKEKGMVSVLNISDLYKTFKSEEFKNKLFNVLDTISSFEKEKINEIKKYKSILEKGYINFKVFKGVFNLLQNNDYIPRSKKLNVEWELLKEKLLTNDFVIKNIDTKSTKNFDRYKDIICIKKEDYEINKRKISSQLRTLFGKERIILPDIEF